MRERRSVNSHEARSIIASARRELRISCSIVSSSTRLSLAPGRIDALCGGSSPRRVCTTVPDARAPRSSVVMPWNQSGTNWHWSVQELQLAALERDRRLGDSGGEHLRALIDRLHHGGHAGEQPSRI